MAHGLDGCYGITRGFAESSVLNGGILERGHLDRIWECFLRTQRAIEFSQRKQAFGSPTSVGKILDKSRPPERRWRYPKPQLFSEVSIEAQFYFFPAFWLSGCPAFSYLNLWKSVCYSFLPTTFTWVSGG